MRREVPSIILAFVGLLMIAETFLNIPAVASLSRDVKNWGIIIGGFALALGSANLARFHIVRIARKNKEWYNSVALLACMAAFALAGVTIGPKAASYAFYYNNFLAPMNTTLQGMTVFFVGSAAYRAFTVRNAEAAILLLTAVIVILSSIPLGEQLWSRIPAISKWIQDVPNLSGQRGIIITSAVGSMAIGLRVLLGLERSHFGGE